MCIRDRFRHAGYSVALLPFLILRAHVSMLFRLPRLLGERRRILRQKRIGVRDFTALMTKQSISVREVASL